MISSLSTESLLNAFPMFGHTGWSALEYAGAFEAARLRDTSATLESLKRKSTASTQDENTTPPSTAARILTYEPRSTISSGYISRDDSIGCASSPISRLQDQKRQRRQTPFKIANPKAARHAPLEPLVAKHRRKASHDTVMELLPQIETDQTGEMGTFGVIQRYFDSQTGGPVLASKSHPQVCSPDPSLKTTIEPIAIYPIGELIFNEPPPAVPDRSPKRLTNPAFPPHVNSIMATGSDIDIAADGKNSPVHESGYLEDALNVPKKRTSKRLDVGQAGRVGCSQVGRLAPPILSHDALTASADMGLNDLSYYLKHTGPSTEPQPIVLERKKMKKLFKVKQRKSLAARVGSVESSPREHADRHPFQPVLAK
ncbi:hypothetical protein CFE70_003626 [Pyrenophora teres f. teres 0-1]